MGWTSAQVCARYGVADVGQRRVRREGYVVTLQANPELSPERWEIDRDRLVFPVCVLPSENVGARGFVADGECLGKIPVLIDGATLLHDGAHGIAQTLAIERLPADRDVCHEAEQRTAPVGAAPG